MKKFFISLLLLAATTATFGQLKVKSDGTIRTASATSSLVQCMMHVGDTAIFDNSTKYGLVSSVADKIAYRGVGIKGSVSSANSYPYSRIGVWGEAGHVLKGNSIELHPGTNVSVGSVLDASNY